MIGGAKIFFIFEDFDRQCLDVFMVVTSLLFCNDVSKPLSWSVSITINPLFLIIILLDVLEQNIQTRWNLVN